MATGTLFIAPIQLAMNTNDDPSSGALAYFFLAGTSTPVTVYQNVGLTTPHAVPVVANSAGRFAEIYLTPGVSYKVDLQTSAGVSLSGYPADNVAAIPASSGGVDVTGTAGVSLSAGDVVYISDGSGSLTAGLWYKADADFSYASSDAGEVGIVPTAITAAATGTIRTAGQLTVTASLIPGTAYYVSATAGGLTSTAPSNERFVGTADGVNSILIAANPKSVTSSGLNLVQVWAFS